MTPLIVIERTCAGCNRTCRLTERQATEWDARGGCGNAALHEAYRNDTNRRY